MPPSKARKSVLKAKAMPAEELPKKKGAPVKKKAASSKTAPPQKKTASKKAVVEKAEVSSEGESEQVQDEAVETLSEGESQQVQDEKRARKTAEAQPNTEKNENVSGRGGRAATEDGLKRKSASASKYFHMRSEWDIVYPGTPDRNKLTQVLTVMRRRSNCPLAENTILWKFNSGRLTFNRPVNCGNALNMARKILGKVFPPKEFQWDKVDINFVQGQMPQDNFETPPRASGGSAPSAKSSVSLQPSFPKLGSDASVGSGNVASASLSVASASLSVPSASVDVASASVGVASASRNLRFKTPQVEGPDHSTLLRFKALHLVRYPLVPAWIPKRGIEHASGSHGAVVFAFNDDLKKDVAIKILASDKISAFFEELEALLVAAAHPCAVKILDVVCLDTRLGFVLERLGPSLLAVMQQSKKKSLLIDGHARVCWPMTHGKFEEGFGGLFSALAFLSDRHLAHSDIKPSNICFKEPDDRYCLHFFSQAERNSSCAILVLPLSAWTLGQTLGAAPRLRGRMELRSAASRIVLQNFFWHARLRCSDRCLEPGRGDGGVGRERIPFPRFPHRGGVPRALPIVRRHPR